MKKFSNYKLIFLLITFLWVAQSCSQQNNSEFLTYHFDKKATVIINNLSSDIAPNISGRYISLLPPDFIRNYVKPEIQFDSSEVILTYNLSCPSSVELFINNIQLPLFLVPGDTLFISTDLTQADLLSKIVFKGNLGLMNEFKLKRYLELGESFTQKGVELINSNLDTVELENKIDSLSQLEIKFIDKYCESISLPKWFTDYEKSEIIYYSAIAQLSGRESDHYNTITPSIEIFNASAIFSPNYYGFLNVYFRQSIPVKTDASEFRRTLGLIYLQSADSLLAGEVKEVYKTYVTTSFIIDFDMYDVALNIIAEEKGKMNEKYLNYLEEYLRDRTTLKPGVLAPDFYLQDINNKFTTLNEYKGNIVLLNFWFPGCKPCINEIPYERKLVDEFENKKFKLINICLFSPEENWRKTIEKFEMRGEHLFANENWQKILIEKYKLGSYPSYILIDETGKIISSSPKRPSEGIGEEITKLLEK